MRNLHETHKRVKAYKRRVKKMEEAEAKIPEDVKFREDVISGVEGEIFRGVLHNCSRIQLMCNEPAAITLISKELDEAGYDYEYVKKDHAFYVRLQDDDDEDWG